MTGDAVGRDRLTAAETAIDALREDVAAVRVDVKDLRDTFAKRPSWSVTAFITISTSLNVGLIVALAKGAS